MKKPYVNPSVEKIAFRYRDQVVVASNIVSGGCVFMHPVNLNKSTPATAKACCATENENDGQHYWTSQGGY